MSNPFQAGEEVLHDNIVRTIYAVYDDENVSLCLLDYDDVEEDYQTPITEIKKLN
jgi:hypothetical protein